MCLPYVASLRESGRGSGNRGSAVATEKVEAGEACDDGNDVNTDACTDACAVAFAVMGRHALIFRPSLTDSKLAMTVTMRMPMAVLPVALLRCAGDGIIRRDLAEGAPGFERCDDGNQNDADGCRINCSEARCGDGVLPRGSIGRRSRL